MFFSRARQQHNNDTATVQTSEANSLLGNLLLDSEWDELLSHLATPEGRHDVAANNDPLNLFRDKQQRQQKFSQHENVPNTKNSAIFAALCIRAPFRVIETIYNMAPERVVLPEDLFYALAVIPSEEEERLRQGQKSTYPYRSSSWSSAEHEQIIHLLLRHCVLFHPPWASSSAAQSPFLSLSPKWILPTPHPTSLTPLAMAAYHTDLPSLLIRQLCLLEPRAMHLECTFFGVTTLPLFISAASPLPPKDHAKYTALEKNRWEKVQSILVGQEWYEQQKQRVKHQHQHCLDERTSRDKDFDVGLTQTTFEMDLLQEALSLPEPTMEQIRNICDEAIGRNEWELVRELCKRYHRERNPSDMNTFVSVQARVEEEGESDRSTKNVMPVAVAEPMPSDSTTYSYKTSFIHSQDKTTLSSLSGLTMSSPFNTTTAPSFSLELIKQALSQRDAQIQQKNNHYQEKQQKQQERDEWAHKNMGLIMYPVDAVVDLASAFVPRTLWKKRKGNDDDCEGPKAVVLPMS